MKWKVPLILAIFFLFAANAKAVLPTVDFSWYPTSNIVFDDINFHPNITTDSNLTSLKWSFHTDGNTNYVPETIDINLFDGFESGALTDWNLSGVCGVPYPYITNNPDLVYSGQYAVYETSSGATEKCLASKDTWLHFKTDTNYNIYAFPGNGGSGLFFELINTGTGTGPTSVIKIDSGNVFVGISPSPTYEQIAGVSVDNNHWVILKMKYNTATEKASYWIYDANGTYLGSALNKTVWTNEVPNQIRANVSAGVSGGFDNFGWGDGTSIVDPIDIDKNETHDFNTVGTKTICLTATNATGPTTVCHNLDISPWGEQPVVSRFDFNANSGFGTSDTNAHVILKCDSNATTVNYKLVFNSSTVYDKNMIPDYNYVPVTPINGENSGTFTCSVVGTSLSDSESNTFKFYVVNFHLVNERSGLPISDFTPFGALYVRSYALDKNFDFHKTDVNSVLISSTTDDLIRLDINYLGQESIFKQFSLSVLAPDSNVNICVASPHEQLYQQIFTSSRITDGVILRHAINNCYAVADYTEYGYQTLNAQYAITIAEPYNLYYFDGNVRTFLIRINGDNALTHNIQTLVLNKTDYNITIASDYVAVSPYYNETVGENDENIVQVSYLNQANDNESVKFDIYWGDSIIYSTTDTTSPNDYSFLWNHSDYNITDTNILKMVLTKTSTGGIIKNKTLYFTLNGVQYGNQFAPAWAIILAAIIVLFGLTIVSTRSAFSWFGIIIVLFAIAILASGPMIWYTVFFEAIMLIVLVYIGFVYKTENLAVS